MSQVSYNGVTIPFPFSTELTQEAVYDEVGGTDWFCTKFDVKTQGILNANYLNQIAPDLALGGSPATNPADLMSVIRTRLLQPRKTLTVLCNGVHLIPGDTGGPGTVDIMNGPKPQSCVITQLTNVSFLITYHIIAHYWECNEVSYSAINNMAVAASDGDLP